MRSTKLAYLGDSYKTESSACVLSMEKMEDRGTGVVLDQTIFYVQGGGQPADQGQICGANGFFDVTDVRLIDDTVYHLGIFSSGTFSPGEEVVLKLDSVQRLLHTRLHSAGHLIDAAVQLLDLPLKPIKGFHFKQGPYVEYHGEISAEKRESTRLCLEQKINDLVAGEFESRIICAGRNEAMAFCGALPDYIGKAGQDIRLVALVPDIACPCGGTHVKNTKEIGTVTLTKIRVKSGQCRISYSLV